MSRVLVPHIARLYTDSSVRDYTHGPMNTITYVVPSLDDDPQAAVASNSLLNSSAWNDDQEFFHTYEGRSHTVKRCD